MLRTSYVRIKKIFEIYVVTNHINGIPLNAWWGFYICEDPAIEGIMLDDLRQDMLGPFENRVDAIKGGIKELTKEDIFPITTVDFTGTKP